MAIRSQRRASAVTLLACYLPLATKIPTLQNKSASKRDAMVMRGSVPCHYGTLRDSRKPSTTLTLCSTPFSHDKQIGTHIRSIYWEMMPDILGYRVHCLRKNRSSPTIIPVSGTPPLSPRCFVWVGIWPAVSRMPHETHLFFGQMSCTGRGGCNAASPTCRCL